MRLSWVLFILSAASTTKAADVEAAGAEAEIIQGSKVPSSEYYAEAPVGSQQDEIKLEEEEETVPPGDEWKGYLWILLICYMFFAQEHVCEAYFVAAIDVCVAKFRKAGSPWGEEAVAGATLCALGCNGPELFTNLIACCVLGGSDVGVGTIVGSEVFNLLVITGGAVLSCPVSPMPIDKIPFSRDSLFYALSIILLAWTLNDGIVTTFESCVLFACAILYTGSVYFTSSIVKALGLAEDEAPASTEGGTKLHGVECEVSIVHHNRMADARDQTTEVLELEINPEGIKCKGAGLTGDTVAELPSMTSAAFSKHCSISKFGLSTSTNRFSTHFALQQPLMAGEADAMLPYADLKEVQDLGSCFLLLTFKSGFMGHETTLKVRTADGEQATKLIERLEKFSKAWVHKYDGSACGAFKHWRHILFSKDYSCVDKIKETMKLPVEVMLAFTLNPVDVKDVAKEERWVGCFCGAMAWLGVFSYLMCSAAGAIKLYFGVPESILGITLCALGTSFPNAVASIIMAQEGKTARAISNALGSNVQNVFLALAFPWVLVTVFPILTAEWFQDFAMPSPGIKEGVFWMMGTLLFMIFFVLIGGCTINKCAGYLLILCYIVYLVIAVLESAGVMSPLA